MGEREKMSERDREKKRKRGICCKARLLEHELDTAVTSTSAIASDASHALCCLQYGMSALMWASLDGHIAAADRLMAAGAKLDLQHQVRERAACHAPRAAASHTRAHTHTRV